MNSGYRSRDTYWAPRPSRIRSSDHRFHPGAWFVLFLIVCGLAGIGYWIYNYQFATETTVTMTVNRLDDQSSGSTHKYLIFATRADGQPEVFQDTDAFFHGKFNSSDLFAQLKPGEKVTCDVYGRRNHLASQYRNVISCTALPPGSAS